MKPMNCINHPDRKAFSICQRYNHGYCRECCTCPDPKGYCKYRTRCIAWQICKKEKNLATEGTEITE
jgi:hypothetical protein